MQTVTLNIEDEFYNHFMELLKNISTDKIEVVDIAFPNELVVSSVDEVRRRVYEAESSEGMTEQEYEKEINSFFKNQYERLSI